MAVEVRPISLEELDEFKRVAATALVMSPEGFVAMRPEFTLCAFEDGKLTTSYAAWPFSMRFNGDPVPVAAVTAVGTLPIHRRRGYLRKITTQHFQQLYEQGERPIAILYAAWAAIYQRYGYAVVSTRISYNIEPQYIRFPFPTSVAGTLRETGDDDFPVFVDLYRRFREDRIGLVHRGREMWNVGVLAPPPSGGFLHKVVYEEEGEPRGYVVHTAQPGSVQSPGNTVAIRDLVWLTPSAYRAVWDYLANMDIVRSIGWGNTAPDDPLPHLLLEPRRLNMTCADGILGRIVDIERAMPGRRYDEEAVLTFGISDALCPWNEGAWRLETSPEGASIARTNETPQVVMPVSTLALLVFGQVTASHAAGMGRLDANQPDALPAWDRTMRTRYRPACPDMF